MEFYGGVGEERGFPGLPLEVLRTARTKVEAFRERSWRADSRPMPALAPVRMMVLPRRSRLGGRGMTLAWVRMPLVLRRDV